MGKSAEKKVKKNKVFNLPGKDALFENKTQIVKLP